jgi:hypothetical protein
MAESNVTSLPQKFYLIGPSLTFYCQLLMSIFATFYAGPEVIKLFTFVIYEF